MYYSLKEQRIREYLGKLISNLIGITKLFEEDMKNSCERPSLEPTF
jgi:hypothetical protein